jgi:plastocyanin
MEEPARPITGHTRLTCPRSGLSGRLSVAAGLAFTVLLAVAAAVRGLEPVSLDIRDSKYIPSTLTVPAGTTVRWINRDEETHTVTSNTERFKSGGLNLGDEYTHTFTTPGEYPYTCALHEFMQGTIVVK